MPAPVGRGVGTFGRADSSGARGVDGYDKRHDPLSRDGKFPYDRDEKMYGEPNTYDRGSNTPGSAGDRPPVPKSAPDDWNEADRVSEIEDPDDLKKEAAGAAPKLKIGDKVRSKDGQSGTIKRMSPYGLSKVEISPGKSKDFFDDELELVEAQGVPGLMIGKSGNGGGGSGGGRTTPGTSGAWSTGWNDETPDDDMIIAAGKGKKMMPSSKGDGKGSQQNSSISRSAWQILEAFVSLAATPPDEMSDGENIDDLALGAMKDEFRSAFDRSLEIVTKLPKGEVLRLIVDLDQDYAASEFLDGMDDDELLDIYRSWGGIIAPLEQP